MTSKKNLWLQILIVFSLFWYLSGTVQFLLAVTHKTSFEGFKDATIASMIWLLPVLAFPRSIKKTSAVIGIVLWIFALPAFGYYLIYQQELSQSLLFILFESNQKESIEYLKNYFDFSILIYLFIFTLIAFLIWKKIPSQLQVEKRFTLRMIAIISILIFFFPAKKAIQEHDAELFINNLSKHISPAPPWQLIIGYMHYQRELKTVNSLLSQFNQIPALENLHEAKKPLPTTAVIVIGESSSRLHFSLYGYPRNTNPKLGGIKNELYIFDHVYASRPNTIESLQQVLSFADQQHPDLYKTKPTLIALMKQAGYKTFWISNQQTLTSRNTLMTTFAQQTDKQVWLNNSRTQNYSYSYDENVLQPFSDALNDSAEKKLIFVHLIGTHMSYRFRYPPAFDYFKDSKDLSSALSANKIERINEYDNAIRYNDTVMYELIQRLKRMNQHSVLVYFSDHGDDVYDSGKRDFQGRNEAEPTLPMYAIPFIVWTSNNWFNQSLLKNPAILSRQFDNSQFIYAWSHLLGIDYKGFSESESIFSDKFQSDTILVGDPYQPKKLKKLENTQ